MESYKIKVFEFGFTDQFPAEFAFDGSIYAGELLYSPFSMMLVQGNGHNILIDCGVNFEQSTKQTIYAGAGGKNPHMPTEVLEAFGISPEDIDSIIITHCHWDHVGGVECFPQAHFYIQKDEYFGWIEAWSKPATFSACRAIVDPHDLHALLDCATEGRLTLLDGNCEVFPGITVKKTEYVHSFALQIVLVETEQGNYALASDTCNRPENILGNENVPGFIPSTKFSVGSPYRQMEMFEKLLSWCGGDAERIISSHDGTLHTRYPAEKTPLGLYAITIC